MSQIVMLTGEASRLAVNDSDISAIRVPEISTAPISVDVCARIHRLDPASPFVLVTEGDLARLLPSIAFAQRTAHRTIAGYALIDPQLGPPALDWPDAPVIVLSRSETARRSIELRGWSYEVCADDSAFMPAVRRFASDVMPI